jgi:hypothetical protein
MDEHKNVFLEMWAPLRDKLIKMAAEGARQAEVEMLTKNWERILKCEKLARELEPPNSEPIRINMEIVGL